MAAAGPPPRTVPVPRAVGSNPPAHAASMEGDYQAQLVAFASSCASLTLMAPLTRVKLILQTQDANMRILTGEVRRYAGWRDALRRLPAEQGLASLWRGNAVACLARLPSYPLNIALKDLIKGVVPVPVSNPKQAAAMKNMFAGLISGFVTMMILYPIDFVRTRLATDVGNAPRDFANLPDMFRRMRHAPRSLFRCAAAAYSHLVTATYQQCCRSYRS